MKCCHTVVQRRFTLICSGDFLSEKITFLTAIVSLKFLVERTREKYSFDKEIWNCQIAKISRSLCWHFSRYFISKIDWFPSLLRVLSLINPRQILNGPLFTLLSTFPHFDDKAIKQISLKIFISNRERHVAIFFYSLFLRRVFYVHKKKWKIPSEWFFNFATLIPFTASMFTQRK